MEVGTQLLAPGPEVVLPGLEGTADGRRPLVRLGARGARAAVAAAAARSRAQGERSRQKEDEEAHAAILAVPEMVRFRESGDQIGSA